MDDLNYVKPALPWFPVLSVQTSEALPLEITGLCEKHQ